MPTDYVEARRTFRTKLRRSAPSPQPFDILAVPPEVDVVEYVSRPAKLEGWISKTPEEERRPAVLFLHGGFAFAREDWEMARPFVDAGYVVMVPILRGENGQAGSFSMFYDEVDDVLAAGEYLAGRPDVDPSRIYLAGHSSGGTLALLTAQASKRFRAVASLSGAPDQEEFLQSGWEEIAPFDPRDTKEVEMRSALAFATGFKCPVRIYYGTKELFFDGESRQTARIAKSAGLDVEAVAVEGDHFSAVPGEIARAMAFFRSQH